MVVLYLFISRVQFHYISLSPGRTSCCSHSFSTFSWLKGFLVRLYNIKWYAMERLICIVLCSLSLAVHELLYTRLFPNIANHLFYDIHAGSFKNIFLSVFLFLLRVRVSSRLLFVVRYCFLRVWCILHKRFDPVSRDIITSYIMVIRTCTRPSTDDAVMFCTP